MEKRLLADGLGWAEGPAVLADGRVCFVETFRSQVSVWDESSGVSRFAYTAGGPNSCVVGADGELYVCQNGGSVGPWRAEEMSVPSIQRVATEGEPAEVMVTEIDGMRFSGPNDLVFGPDKKLYFTDPGTYRPDHPDPSRIFVLDELGHGSLVVELDPATFPNGIAIESDGSVVWAESYTGMVRRCRPDGSSIEDIGRLPGDNPVADGLAVSADGRLFVTTVNGGGIDVLHADGNYDQFIAAGTIPTNCVFAGSQLFMTDAGAIADTADASFAGQLWLIETELDGGPTWTGTVATTEDRNV
ncbi:SMP-30/gluconolactonase/LRE family protein [soil metagenome]